MSDACEISELSEISETSDTSGILALSAGDGRFRSFGKD
jgi:hypothetical protein